VICFAFGLSVPVCVGSMRLVCLSVFSVCVGFWGWRRVSENGGQFGRISESVVQETAAVCGSCSEFEARHPRTKDTLAK